MSSCTLVPTYHPHFYYAANLLESHNKFVNSDIYFIFSSELEHNIFNELNHDKRFYSIVIQDIPMGVNPITYKKFSGVQHLIQKYDYVGVFDDESLFVKELDTDIVYKEISDSKIFKSNRRHGNHLSHLKEVAEIMGYHDNEILKAETDDFTQYWWFNDICVYDAENFRDFFDWFVTHENQDRLVSEFKCFDYLIYSMWLIVNKGYKLDKKLQQYSFAGAVIETNMNNNDISYEFKSYMDRNINHANIEHIKVQIMIDRDMNHCLKEGEKRKWQE